MPLDMLIEETKGLSDESLMEVVRFVRFLKHENDNQSKQKHRKAGRYRGAVLLTDDFDAPLPEFKEYM